jgi:endoribonuclease Dicer
MSTGSGKTFISILLLRHKALESQSRNQRFLAVFVAPKVALVVQQAEAIARHTNLDVIALYGALGIDFWDKSKWQAEINGKEVLVVTPQVLLDKLRHGFISVTLFTAAIYSTTCC